MLYRSHSVLIIVLLTYDPGNTTKQFHDQGSWLDQAGVLPFDSHSVMVQVCPSCPLWVLGK